MIMSAAVFGAALLLQCIGAWQDSQTTDEAVHLSAGRSYWQTHDFRLNPEHPPLIKLLAALPLLAVPSTHIDTTGSLWSDPDVSQSEWQIGRLMLYRNDTTIDHARAIMFLGRLPMILVWAGLASVIFFFCYQRWGDVGGFVGLTVFAFDPNFLGHGHLVTTDLGVTLGFFGTVWLLDRFLESPSWRRLGWLSLVFGLTQNTKYSAIILWIIVPLVGLVALAYHHRKMTSAWWWRMIASLVIVTSVVTWAVYGFEVKRIDTDPRIGQLWQQRADIISQGTLSQQPPLVQHVVQWTDPTQPLGKFLERGSHWSVPAYSYWRGLFSTFSHDLWGHPSYLLGQTGQDGWWYYFPVALVVKTPAVTLLLLMMAGTFGLMRLLMSKQRWAERWPLRAWVYGLPPVLFFAWSMTSHINIGFRHVFPVEPFIFVAIAGLVAYYHGPVARRWQQLIMACALLVPLTAFAAWPNTIGYFSEIVGGPHQGHRYLLDSNLDWNQDAWRLSIWLKQHPGLETHVVLFGSLPYPQFLPGILPVLTDQDIAAGQRPTGVVIISAGQLYNVDGPFSWLRTYQPSSRIGSSINIYDFR